jgi:hypothetical protein
MNRFTETQLEQAFIEMLQEQKYTYLKGGDIDRSPNEVLIKEDLRDYLHTRYKHEQITPVEIESIIRQLESFPSSDLYESNKAIMKMISDGFPLKREDRSKKDLFVQPIDFRKYASSILVRDKEKLVKPPIPTACAFRPAKMRDYIYKPSVTRISVFNHSLLPNASESLPISYPYLPSPNSQIKVHRTQNGLFAG